ncbi:MAG: hypothetical protein HC833_11610 [Leptolyngbyaceae cyanobacterium RM1_406_9]|nr:hypothetical protein [Leptolyngbyaceae cyanobacterium RM1_406_9]
MKRMRKVVQTVLGLAGVAIVLTGCGGNQVAENSTSVAQQGEATVAVEGTDGQTSSSAPSQDVAASPPALPVPNLIPPTTPSDRSPPSRSGETSRLGRSPMRQLCAAGYL